MEKEKIRQIISLSKKIEELTKLCELISEGKYYLTFVKDIKDEDGNLVKLEELPANYMSEEGLRYKIATYHTDLYKELAEKVSKIQETMEAL